MANKSTSKDERLRIMKGVLEWEGAIDNARVRDLFGVQLVQASRLIHCFHDVIGNRCYDDRRTRTVKLLDPDVPAPQMSLEEYAWHSAIPSVVNARVNLSSVRPIVFATLHQAMVHNVGVSISHASLDNPVFKEQKIFPHSMIRLGRRWLARAWSENDAGFMTFDLRHIKDPRRLAKKASNSASDDSEWNSLVKIRLSAHRALSPDQQGLVRGEFFNGATSKRLLVRSCLSAHVIQDLRVATDPDTQLPPDFLLEIGNIT